MNQRREICLLDIHNRVEYVLLIFIIFIFIIYSKNKFNLFFISKLGKKHIDDALRNRNFSLSASKIETKINVEFKNAKIAREVKSFLDSNIDLKVYKGKNIVKVLFKFILINLIFIFFFKRQTFQIYLTR